MGASTKACIVFDFGAVVFRWQPAQLLRRELPGVATDAASAAHWAAQIFQGPGSDWGDFDRGLIGTAEVVERITARTGLGLAEVRHLVDAVPRELQPVPETVELIARLHAAGHALYYLSNMPAPMADHLERSHAVMRCFRDGVFSGRVRLCKPEPAVFELAAQRFGVAPAALHFLDDHVPNVQAAQACGWQALTFTSAAQAEAAMREQGWIA